MEERRRAYYSIPRRRVRHRDKIGLYIAMLSLYFIIHEVVTSSISPTVASTSETTVEVGGEGRQSNSSGDSIAEFLQTKTTTPHGTTPVPTWRPKRENCTPPAIEQFPRPLMGPSARKHGGLIIHIVVAVYAFIALAIVCDDYFVSSLDRICEGGCMQLAVIARSGPKTERPSGNL